MRDGLLCVVRVGESGGLVGLMGGRGRRGGKRGGDTFSLSLNFVLYSSISLAFYSFLSWETGELNSNKIDLNMNLDWQ